MKIVQFVTCEVKIVCNFVFRWCHICDAWVLKLISLFIHLELKDIHGRRDAVQRKREPVDSYQCAGDSCLILGTVDAYGHLIVSRLDTVAEDIDRASYSVPPRDSGVGEGSWAGLCFSPTHQSTVAVARELCKSIDIYDQDIHIRSLRT
ncbi:unnamed protein product [Triticum turgidum subsp. durum]|uniref:Uncharacterized protein n=1 Tax=Triticum turgidum subsp. durum TaxID=4567 RepID=A0A9R0RSB3_TRITD|nr:unnamed protein product [Triticum turgidum subsp. durum]